MMTAIRIITIAIGMAICDFIMNYSNAHPWGIAIGASRVPTSARTGCES